MHNGYLFYMNSLKAIFTDHHFKGWGRKKTGRFALWCYEKFGGTYTLMEDGFLGITFSTKRYSLSYIEDDLGIYYDATASSRLEEILNTYDFASDETLMSTAKKAIALIKEYHLSKYNDVRNVDEDFKKKYKLDDENGREKRILIVAQTLGDLSLHYGMADRFTTEEMIDEAIRENPDAKIYIKVHPDVIQGTKKSDIDMMKINHKCIVIGENVNPLSLLEYMDKVYTKTSQMGFEALILGKECVCFGMPFYAGWGMTKDKIQIERRKKVLSVEEVFSGAYILYAQYINRHTQKKSTILEAIEDMLFIKNIEDRKVESKAYLFGFSRWKHLFVKPFFREYEHKNIVFINPVLSKNHLTYALKKGLNKNHKIYIWGRKSFKELEAYAEKNNISILRVEDGFIRSVGLGSDLTQAYSLVVDSRGIYFDPTQESALENILNNYVFSDDIALMQRAKKVKQYILDKKISKYNPYESKNLNFPKNKKLLLVPGQVEDDASIIYGAKGMSNLSLLKQVRKESPLGYIIYKPHPDVIAGNRKGHIGKDEALKYCDEVIEEVALDSILVHMHEVHTMTSLVGFEAILRGIEVHTHGMPFYAGWGLSEDKKVCIRRDRNLSVDALVAGTLILYPKYLHPSSKELCRIEDFLDDLDLQRELVSSSKYVQIKLKIRNLISRKVQLVLSYIF